MVARAGALALASMWILTAACSSTNEKAPTPPAASPAGSPPVAVAALEGLLLSPADINTAMRTTGMTVAGPINEMWDDSAEVADKDCRFADGPAEARSTLAADGPPSAEGQYSNPTTSLILSD
jgi:hypothetical protein